MAPSTRWTSGWNTWLGALALSALGCSSDFEKLELPRSTRGTLGEEVYKTLCRRVAGTELPHDLDGRESRDVCLGAADTVAAQLDARGAELPTRIVALASRRARLVGAVDTLMPGTLASDLDEVLRSLLPYYEPPDDLLPQNSRAVAALMRRLAEDPRALRELARLGRGGMVPLDVQAGLLGALADYERLAQLARALVPPLFDADLAGAEFDALRAVLALELATTGPEDDAARARRLRFEALAFRDDATGSGTFASDQPLYTAARGPDGLPVPSALGAPFVDDDGDGEADVAADTLAHTGAPLPEPFAVVGEGDVARDAAGRACAIDEAGEADCDRTLYTYTPDRDPSFLAAAFREAHGLAGSGKTSLVGSSLAALPGLFEPRVRRVERYGNASIEVASIDRGESGLLELAHAAGAALPAASYDEGLALTERVIEQAERPLVQLLSALAEVERSTRPGDDGYADAKLPDDHTFFDDLLWEAEKLARHRRSADGEGAIEAMSRAAIGVGRDLAAPGSPLVQIVDRDKLRHEGALLATFMRYKDEWRINPRGESERALGEPTLIGAFSTPVDRSQPDTPVTCGVDGCGGLVEGTPYEPYRQPNQNCMVQRAGRPPSSKDCGAPANQSILQRSLGLLWEMAGRLQCNKAISLRDLLDFVGDDPCAVLDPAVSCSSDRTCSEALGQGFACDEDRSLCFAESSSQACGYLRSNRQRQVNDTARDASGALAKDYVCPADPVDAPCHAYEDRFPSAFVDGPSGDPGDTAVQPCHLLNLPDVGRTFGRVLTGEFTLDIPNPWVRRYLEDIARASPALGLPRCADDFRITDPSEEPPCVPEAASLTRDFYQTLPDDVDTLGELVEFLLDDSALFSSDADTRDLRPDSKALSHVLFAGKKGASSLELFDTLLLRGAPKTCEEAPKLPACAADDTAETPEGGCCIADLSTAPLRYRLDTFYGATSFAWEHELAFSDGQRLSFLDTMAPLADVFNRLDYVAGQDDPRDFEDLSYGLTSIGKLVAEHYDSADNPVVQTRRPDGLWYRRGTGISRYEPLIADMLDDAALDLGQAGPLGGALFPEDAATEHRAFDVFRALFGMFEALEGLDLAGRDGIAASARISESLLNPHAFCAGDDGDGRVLDGLGACDADAPVRAPLARRSGRDFPCASDGTCYDGVRGARRYLSPITLATAALHDLDTNSRGDQRARDGARGLLSGLVDGFARFERGRFASRRLYALLLTSIAHSRERYAEARAAGTLGALAREGEDDLDDALAEPLVGPLVDLLGRLSRDDVLLEELDALVASALGEDHARLWTALSSDGLASTAASADYAHTLRALAAAIAPNIDAVLAGDEGTPSFSGSYLDSNLRLLGETARADEGGVLSQVLGNAGRSGPSHAPLTVLSEAALALERPEPSSSEPLSASDYAHALSAMADVLTDERRGFERLYEIVRCTLSPGSELCGD
jgi:hypothetical protein